jgi:HlyD family secretion protein
MKLLSSTPPHDITGASMDAPIPPRRRRRIAAIAGVAVAGLAAALALRMLLPQGLQVPMRDVRIATVERGMFRDDVAVRAHAVPQTSVILDSTESGRVEEVIVRDGASVKQGELLFRLSNPQRHLDLLARQSEHAQQISNLSNLRLALEASRAEHQRRLSELRFGVDQAEKRHARDVALAEKGFLSSAAVEESTDRVSQQRRMLADEQSTGETDLAIKRDAIRQMERAIAGLESGLKLVAATVDALAVRAPAAGRLTDFHLQVGETVRPDQHIGRIDDPVHFRLSAQIDEYYLRRVAVGRRGMANVNGRDHAIEVSRVYPQIKDGRFTVEFDFIGRQPEGLSPGQGIDTQVTLGEPSPSLLLPNGSFINDGGGAWVFVLAPDGATAERRAIRSGRRNAGQIEVLSGLAPGDRVIVSSYAGWGDAQRLQFAK